MRQEPTPGPAGGRRGRRLAARMLASVIAGAAALALSGPAQADEADSPSAVAADTLGEAAAQSGRFAGVGSTVEGLENEYPEIAAREFSSITPGNEMKWGSLEWTRGQYNWSPADRTVAFAQQHGQQIHGHTLVWHHQLPGWVENGNFADGELLTEMERHITTTAGRYAGDIARWDVVNEPFNEDGSLRDSVFLREIGPDYIAEALRATHAADPGAKLYINDYNVEGLNAKSDAMYELAQELLARDVPLDGVGLQSHFIVGQVPSTMEENIQRFVDLGMEVAITEVDIRIPLPANAAEYAQQAQDYATVTEACLAVEGCVGVTVWGVSDCCSWIPDTFPGYGDAHVWDANYQPKPAYDALLRAFGGEPATDAECTAAYRVTSRWDSGSTVDLAVTPSVGINGWTVTFDLPAGEHITSSWNAQVSQSGTTVTARNLSWNAQVGAGGSLAFGFTTDRGNTYPAPAVTLNGTTCAA